MKSCPRILIAAPASGSGKTTLTCGMLKAFINRGLSCVSFKCGPDYIDPMFHKNVLGIQGGNLDSYFLKPEEIRSLFCRRTKGADVAVIEGVMGYYDGVAGISTKASTYEVGQILDCPVLFLVDGKKSSLSIAALMKGFLEYKKEHKIVGVILNRTGKIMAERLRAPMEELGIELLGYIPEMENITIESRHLGLKMPQEILDLNRNLDQLAKVLENSLNLDRILELAAMAERMGVSASDGHDVPILKKQVRIGVAKDEAFSFYYQENLELLEAMGSELVYFSPIHDCSLPKNLDGLILGGGYPELYGPELEKNVEIRQEIRLALKSGLPLLAECGGFLYLHNRLQGKDGNYYWMVGYFESDAYKTERLSKFGYIELKCGEDLGFVKEGERIKAHEFHYWESEHPGDSFLASKPLSERTWPCICGSPGQIAGFPHLYYQSNPEMMGEWLAWCAARKEGEI